MGLHSEAELDRKFVETAKLLNIYLNHFPKFEKYALCQQIRLALYGTYALIVEGQALCQKTKPLHYAEGHQNRKTAVGNGNTGACTQNTQFTLSHQNSTGGIS